jgi:hypothetical protein
MAVRTDFDIIHAIRRGIVPDIGSDSGAGLRAIFAELRGKDPTRVILAPGRYDFFAENCDERCYPLSNTDFLNPRRSAIVLRDLEDVQLELTGVDLRFHGRLMPITIDHCRRVSVKGGTIDWDLPLTAQGVVLGATSELLELQIDPRRHPFEVEDGRIVFGAEGWRAQIWGAMEFDPQTGHIPPGSGDRSPGAEWRRVSAEHLGGGRVNLRGQFRQPPRVGNVLVLRFGPRDHAGVFIVGSSDVAIGGLTLHHTSGLGILCQHSENLEFSQVQVVPSVGRSFSGHDDGIHVSNCKGHVQILGCRFAGLMDDPVNVHGTSVRIVACLGDNRLRCRFIHPQSVAMPFAQPGDTVSFLDRKSLNSRATGKVRAVSSWDMFTFDISFDEAVPGALVVGDALENLSWAPDLTIRDSFFGCCRARGLLISTPGRVRIEDNRFESSGSAVLIAGDANYWYESGAVRDVLIRGNYFADICDSSRYQFTEGVISIFPEVDYPDQRQPFHRNIRIEGNEFATCDIAVLYAFSVEGLAFKGNRIVRSHRFAPRREHQHMVMHGHRWGDDRQHLIALDHCRSVAISGNCLVGEILDRVVSLRNTPDGELVLDPGDGLAAVDHSA